MMIFLNLRRAYVYEFARDNGECVESEKGEDEDDRTDDTNTIIYVCQSRGFIELGLVQNFGTEWFVVW